MYPRSRPPSIKAENSKSMLNRWKRKFWFQINRNHVEVHSIQCLIDDTLIVLGIKKFTNYANKIRKIEYLLCVVAFLQLQEYSRFESYVVQLKQKKMAPFQYATRPARAKSWIQIESVRCVSLLS